MKRFSRILCVVDPWVACEAVLTRATALAESNQAGLSVVSVASVPAHPTPGVRIGSRSADDAAAALVEEHTRRLEAAVAPYRGRRDLNAKALAGIPFLEIVREVLRGGHDLVVKAPDDAGWLKRLLGSDDMHLLRKCPCPVWLINRETARPFRRILAAVDVDESYPPEELEPRRALNRQILEMAASLALSEFGELHVAHAWEAFGEGTLRGAFLNTPESEVASYVEATRREHADNLDRLMRHVREWVGEEALDYLEPRTHLLKGGARKEIPALAEKLGVDLIVMGTVARTGVAGFIMGNTAETILYQISCPVLAIKPPGFKTPVTLED